MASNPTPESSEQPLGATESLQADQLLPPVEAPSGRFIVQLFVVPAVIVFAVVMLWLLVTTLATQGDQDPTKIVAALRGSQQARWQKADELANMLRMESRYPKLKQNTELAAQLAQLLDEQVEAGRDDDNSISLRYYLCRVLGEFHVDQGVEVLLKTARQDPERDVRREAINALAVLGNALPALDPPQQLASPQLVETFTALARDPNDLIRSQTAFALGVLVTSPDADPELTQALEQLVDDLYADARYNAALGLARQGNLRAVEAVVEMLDPEALALCTQAEKTPQLQRFKRDTILDNALEAASQLLEKHPQADALRAALRQFADTAPSWQPAAVPTSLVNRAQALLAP
jgi:hypothetical protein